MSSRTVRSQHVSDELAAAIRDAPELLDALTEREAAIIWWRLGLDGGKSRTLDEIGRALGLTRERIRQIEKQAASKLRRTTGLWPEGAS